MSYTIRIHKNHPNQNPEDLLKTFRTEYQTGRSPNLFTKTFNSREELQDISDLFENKRKIDWLESLIIPIRTDSIEDFCQDFFLPGFFNIAVKTSHLALKIFLCIAMPIFDVFFFPVRVVTAIPRAAYNAIYPKEHALYQYLIGKGVAAKDLDNGYTITETLDENGKIEILKVIQFNRFQAVYSSVVI